MIEDATSAKDEHMSDQPNTLTDLQSAASQAQAAGWNATASWGIYKPSERIASAC
jgi:hypothetical protein